MEFENKNLIVVKGEDSIQIDTIEELSQEFFGKEYLEKNDKEKLIIRYKKIYPYSLLEGKKVYLNKNTEIKNGKTQQVENFEDGLLIDNDVDFFLSLCGINYLQILEKKTSNIFTKGINKEKMKGNYVHVNKFVDKILKKDIYDE